MRAACAGVTDYGFRGCDRQAAGERSRHALPAWEDARMSEPVMIEQPKTALVFGARNLGRAVAVG